MEPRSWVTAALLLWVLAAAAVDIRQRRVPNALILVAAFPAAAALALSGQGLLGQDWISSLTGLAVGAAVFLPGFLRGAVGGGDVKLAACCGLVLGLSGSAVMALVAAIFLGLMAVFASLRKSLPDSRKLRIPAAPAIGAGFALVLLIRQLGA